MSKETTIIQIGDWILRRRLPEGKGPYKLLVLLHGWTGDEDSMWIFTHRLEKKYMLISPRGIFNTPLGGYGWQDNTAKGWPKAGDFQTSINALLDLVKSLDSPGINLDRFDLMGFSQGAAMAYMMALMYPNRIDKLAGLSGFLPEGIEGRTGAQPLQGKKVFVAHGRMDEIVPIGMARRVVQEMKNSGAEVLYCEEDVGHKLSSGCFRGMGEYFANPR
jgi:phospholipase/carboxylesterase